MNIQAILIIVIFIAAVYYVGRIIYKSIFAQKSCGSNCKCGVDFTTIAPDKQSR
ncbi:FeoB-associated Cys-rich membrane protein [Mucilaginibacter sp.]|uniref:FeoB-associated Cys-rich membrane protein n=1 Tax=Mucilaginibacter sp. TaxID=1882438 RepID=UPI0035BC7EEB